MRRTVRITTEAWRERIIIRGRASLALSFCAGCGAVARFVTPETAAAMIHADTREIYRRIESGDLHYVEVNSVALRVCADSLLVIDSSTTNRAGDV